MLQFKLTTLKHSVLFHLLDWEYDQPEFVIDDDIRLVNLDGHLVNKLYYSLCEQSDLDDGEPFHFHSALILGDDKEDFSMFPSISPASISSTILNLLIMIHGGTLGHCRVISSKDDFKTSWGTYELYDQLFEGMANLEATDRKLDSHNLKLLLSICMNLKKSAASNLGRSSRISNALDYFYLAWNVHKFEQTALGLAIVIETLFAPHSNTEISHQVSFNLAKFIAISKGKRQEVYKMFKKFYSIRSKIIHGDTINNDELDSLPGMFKLIGAVLLKILSDGELILLFNDNKLRKQYLENLIFE